MPGIGRLITRRTGAFGLAMTAWDIWRRIPPQHRKTLMRQARKHGPMVIAQVRKHGPSVAKQWANRRPPPR